MGLDMYLYEADKNGNYDWEVNEIGYWRKANQIHNWFVNNVQSSEDDCGDYVVEKGEVEKLLAICKTVIVNSKLVNGQVTNGYRFVDGIKTVILTDGKYIENESVAQKLLPTSSGFFFGGTEYDQRYIEQLEDTVKILESILETFDFENNTLIYSSSW